MIIIYSEVNVSDGDTVENLSRTLKTADPGEKKVWKKPDLTLRRTCICALKVRIWRENSTVCALWKMSISIKFYENH